MRQDMMKFWDGRGISHSAGPYANNLHLAPDKYPHQHLVTQFLQANALHVAHPTVSMH